MMNSCASERWSGGFALVVVLFVLLALALLTSGAVFISTEEAAIARAAEELLHARLAAESAVREELLGWDAAASRELPVGAIRVTHEAGGSGTPPGAEPAQGARGSTTTTVERLAGPHFLIHANAVTARGTVARAAAIVRIVELDELWRTFPGAISTAGAVESWGPDALQGLEADAGREDAEKDCADSVAHELEAIFGSALRPPLEVLPAGGSDEMRFGPFDRRALQRLADRIEFGTVVPSPAEVDGECDLDAPANWGAPRMPSSPCFDAFPTIYAAGDLHVAGGLGQGVLIVEGDLTLTGESEFFGVVLLSGDLRLSDRAMIHGAVAVVGDQRSARLEGESRIAYSPCAIRAALAHASITNGVFHPRNRGWIPQF